MLRFWIIGVFYLLIVVLDVLDSGFLSPNWIPWALLAVGIFTWEPAAPDGKKTTFSDRKKRSLGATISGVVMLAGLVVYHWRH